MKRKIYFELYGISSWLYTDRSLEEALPKIAQAGFKKVELWGNKVHLDPRATPDIRAIKSSLRDLGLRVHSVHLPFSGIELGYPDYSLKSSWLELMGIALEYCLELECQIAVAHVSGNEWPVENVQYKDCVEISRIFIQELKPFADKLGVKLALENLLRDKFVFGESLAEIARVFPEEDLGFCLDTGHAALSGLNIADELQVAGQRLISVHANNNDGCRDAHQLPSHGVLDWQKIEESLTIARYEGCRVLELYGGDNPDMVLEKAKNLWRYI